jgi:hypothetical protein
MTGEEAIRIAIETIGEGKPGDYILSPSGHATGFREKAPDLAGILGSSDIASLARQYETHDRDALAAQKKFRRIFNLANACVFLTGIFITLVLATAIVFPDQGSKYPLLFLSLGGVITGGLASMYLFMMKQGKYLEEWMTLRAKAETTRLNFFSNVIKTPASPGNGSVIPVELLKLEYFRRFQLDVQRTYYSCWGSAHRARAEKILFWSALSVAGAAISSGAAGVLGVLSPKFAAIAAAGTVFAGIGTFFAMREAVNQDRRNAERYRRTWQFLEELSSRLDQVRKAVFSGGMKPLEEFAGAVNEQLSLEHRQWMEELNEAGSAFGRLETTLKEYSEKITPKQG